MRLAVSFLLIFAVLFTNAQQVVVDKLPKSTDEFIQLRNKIATTPAGGATMFMIAMKVYESDKDLGNQFFVLAVDKNRLETGSTYKGYALRRGDIQLITNQMAKDKNLTNAYIDGSSVDNGYFVKFPYKFVYSTNPYSGDIKTGPFKVFIKCSGAASPRPITLKKNDKGIWKAANWSSVLVGIKKVAVSDDL